jgi:hypothetical protein
MGWTTAMRKVMKIVSCGSPSDTTDIGHVAAKLLE